MRIPKKISPNPVIEAVVELRFETCVPSEAVFGVVYPVLDKIVNGQFEKLPILQLPEQVRMNDVNFKFAPHFQFKNSDFQVNVGPRVLAIIATEPYKGWNEYSSIINEILNRLDELKIIKKVDRLGIRYVDFFDDLNITQKLKFKVQRFPYLLDSLSLASTFKVREPFTTNLNIATNQTITVKGKTRSGSIFDTDTYVEFEDTEYKFEDILDHINEAHNVGKEVFFSSLEGSFIAELNPEYD